jgi:hypothetical protein
LEVNRFRRDGRERPSARFEEYSVRSSFFSDFLSDDILLDNGKRTFFFCRWQRLWFRRFTEVAFFDRQLRLIEVQLI